MVPFVEARELLPGERARRRNLLGELETAHEQRHVYTLLAGRAHHEWELLRCAEDDRRRVTIPGGDESDERKTHGTQRTAAVRSADHVDRVALRRHRHGVGAVSARQAS